MLRSGILTVLTLCLGTQLVAASPRVGDPAPLFEAPSTAGTIGLKDYRGKKAVVLAFYYADFTSG